MELSGPSGRALLVHLDRAQVLDATIAQLRKDLGSDDIEKPPLGPGTFEALRKDVLKVLKQREKEGSHALQVVLYRVDIPEKPAKEAMKAGGVKDLSALVTLRCLQKVLTRMRSTGAR